MISTLGTRCLSLLAMMFISACASTPAEHFYSLDTNQVVVAKGVGTQVTETAPFSLLINRVTVPESVDRPQLVLRGDQSQLRIDEQHRWSESLRQAIPRIVASDLRQRFSTARVAVSGDSVSNSSPTYFLAMDVVRFDSRLGDGVRLGVHWQLRNATTTLRDTVTDISETAGTGGYEAVVAAHRRALATLADTIAAAIATAPR